MNWSRVNGGTMSFDPNAESQYQVIKMLMPLAGYEDVVTYGIFLVTARGLKHIASAENFDEAKRIIEAHMDHQALDS